MQTPSFEPILDFYKSYFSSLNQISTVGMQSWLALTNQQFSFYQSWMQALPDQQRVVAAIKEPKDILRLQADLASKQQQLASEHLNQTTKLMMETKEKVTAWADEQFDSLNSALKEVAAAPLKKAA